VPEQPCPFCEINTGRAPATFVHEWSDAIAIVPLDPVVDGHTLIIPKTHVTDFADDPDVRGDRATGGAALPRLGPGARQPHHQPRRAATQSVFHLHLHLVPRAENDGLALPWYSGKKKTGLQINVHPHQARRRCLRPGLRRRKARPMTARSLPVVQPTLRMWQILRRCYRGQNPVAVLGRGLEMLAGADGHLTPDGQIKRGVGGRSEVRRPA
jgi:histidine triad (HIT) family protein